MQYKLVKRDGDYYVAGLKGGFDNEHDQILIFSHPGGDVDTVHEKGDRMLGALYDLYQVNDNLHDGDEFTLRGRVVYRCEGVHVQPVAANDPENIRREIDAAIFKGGTKKIHD